MRKIFTLAMAALISLNVAAGDRKDTTDNNRQPGKWTATYYGDKYKTQRHTANGDVFNKNAMTCAAPSKYKFGTVLRVVNKNNGKEVTVKVTDRGAFGNSNIDLTWGAFGLISEHKHGRIPVEVYVVEDVK